MKITVWHNCKVVGELDLPDAPGPNISLDPYNDLIGTEKDNVSQTPVSYKSGLDSVSYKNGLDIRKP